MKSGGNEDFSVWRLEGRKVIESSLNVEEEETSSFPSPLTTQHEETGFSHKNR